MIKPDPPTGEVLELLNGRTPGRTDPKGTFDPLIGDYVCGQIAKGATLIDTLDMHPAMPDRVTWWRWTCDRPDLATQYARARESQAEVMMHHVLTVGHNSNAFTAAADTVAFKAFTWAAARLNPAAYGDRMQHQHGGSIQHQHRKLSPNMSQEELQEIYFDMIKQPLPIGGPAPLDVEYKDVTPKTKRKNASA